MTQYQEVIKYKASSTLISMSWGNIRC